MATVRALSADRMEAIEAASVVDGEVVGDDLILTRFDTSTINAGNVRGATGSPGVSAEDLEDAVEIYAPAGTVRFGVKATADPGWLLFNQSIAGCDVAYPALWAAAPAIWKSGTTLNLPNIANRVLMVAGTTANGATGGANSRTITNSNLPNHQHTMDHDHPSATTGFGGVDHVHPMTHDHPSSTTASENATHYHAATTNGQSNSHTHGSPIESTYYEFVTAGETMLNIYAAGTDYAGKPSLQEYAWGNTGPNIEDHTHTVNVGTETASHGHDFDIPNYVGNTGTANQYSHTHVFDVTPFTGLTGFFGGGTALDTTPAHIALIPQIKAH